jgi:signal transduction histidine kinase
MPDPERLQRSLQTIDQQTYKLNRLVAHLLDIARLQAGRLILDRQPYELTNLAGSVVDMLQNSTALHRITLDALSPVTISIDSIRLEQVLVNLLSNAIKYSPDGGSIEVEVLKKEDKVAIAVTDHGVGIPLERRSHIFDRFYQAHADGYLGGMGLGLYISHQIVELHGGQLYAEFPDEGGTRFVIELPLQP